MTRMTGPDCAVMCNLINIHTYTHTLSTTEANYVASAEEYAFMYGHRVDVLSCLSERYTSEDMFS